MPTQVVTSLESLDLAVPQFLGINTHGGCFGLVGPLGVGKTTFVRSVIEQLASLNGLKAPRVVSPSYVLHQLYSIGSATVDHFDLYRLEALSREGLMEIGYFEAQERAEKGGWLFVEWPERIPNNLRPQEDIVFEFCPDGRQISWI